MRCSGSVDETRQLQGSEGPFAEQAMQEARDAVNKRWHSGKERDKISVEAPSSSSSLDLQQILNLLPQHLLSEAPVLPGVKQELLRRQQGSQKRRRKTRRKTVPSRLPAWLLACTGLRLRPSQSQRKDCCRRPCPGSAAADGAFGAKQGGAKSCASR